MSSHLYETGISYDKTQCTCLLSYDKMQCTCLLSVIVFHMVRITCLLSAFKKDRYEANQNSQS